MPSYQGGKASIRKPLVELLNSYRKPGQLFVEPFLGGCNILPYMENPRIGSEIEESLILLYKHIRDGGEMFEYPTREQHKEQRHAEHSAYRGFVGLCSFRGDFFAGYCPPVRSNVLVATGRVVTHNDATSLIKAITRIQPLLEGANLLALSYEQLSIPDGSLVYCDPPYQGTLGYKTSFDHEAFWNWVRELSARCTVLVSEYNAPDDFECIWSKEKHVSLGPRANKIRVEKVFKLKETI